MNFPMTKDTCRFRPMIERFTYIKQAYGDKYPIIFYEPSINCQEKKALKNLIQGNSSIHLFSEFKEASKFVQSLGISFLLIISEYFDEKTVTKNFQGLEKIYGRPMFDFEEEAFLKEIFGGISHELIKSLKIKAYVFISLLDFNTEDMINGDEEEEVMVICDLKDMTKAFRQEFCILWYDPYIKLETKEIFSKEFDIEERNIYTNFQELLQRIHNSNDLSYHLIMTGKRETEKIINDIDKLKQMLLCLYIYSDDPKLLKIKNRQIFIQDSIEKLVPKIIEGIRTKSKLTNSFPAFAIDFDTFDKSGIYYLHYYLQGLINFKNRKQAKGDFLELARRVYESKRIFEFEQEYHEYNKDKIFKWYAMESPVYKLVNNCLRIATSDSILYCRFILRDLERAIRDDYQEKSHEFNGVVYRGAYISQDEWKKLQANVGKEIEMYGFLSTSQDLKVAKKFLSSDPLNKILITIVVPPLPAPELNEQGFANISQNSGFQEAEILFNVRSKFRIVEVGVTKTNDQGKECRHLVLLYGAQLLRKYMTKFQPAISLELKLPSEVMCGLCRSVKDLFAFQQEVTEVRCLDCLITCPVPKDTPLLALNSENLTEKNELFVKSFKGQLLAFNQAIDLPYYGYKCLQCQESGKKNYYKWINLKTGEGFEQCSDCFKEKRRIECHLFVAETNPFAIWQEYQPKWETVDANYQAEVSISIGGKNMDQGDVYFDVQKFDLCIEYARKFVNQLNRKRWREASKITSFNKMGKANEASANYQKAFEFYAKVVDLNKFRHKERELSAAYDFLAAACRDLGQKQEELKWSVKSLSIMEGIYGENHPETAINYNNIAVTYMGLEKYQEALEYFAKALKIRKATFGDNHPETALSYCCYARACRMLGKYKKAFQYDKKALDINKAIFGEKHPVIAHSYNNYAAAFKRMGKHQEAFEFFTKALDINKAFFGEKHPVIAHSYHYIADAFESLGKHQEAFEFFTKALDIRKSILGEEHPDTADSYQSISTTCQYLEQFQKGLEYSKKAMKAFNIIYGEMHQNTAASYNSYAVCCEKLGQSKEAFTYIFKAVDIGITVLGGKHPDTILYKKNMAAVILKPGLSPNHLKSGA